MGDATRTDNFGFKKVPNGDLVMGKVLNDSLDSIDDSLFKAVHTPVQKDIFGLAQPDGAIVGGSPAWVPLLGPGNPLAPPVVAFADAVELKKLRLIVTANSSGSGLDFSIALASAPAVPLTLPITVPAGTPLDAIVAAAGPVLPTDSLVVIGMLNGAPGAPGVFDIQAVVTADVQE